jgi:WD40 repeat protein
VAAAAGDIIYVWDITGSDPLLIKTLPGHTKTITCLTFSSSSTLISASLDQSVKFWQIDDPSTNPVVGDPMSTLLTSAPIQSISLQAENGIAISSDLDGVVRVWDISTGLCKASFQTPAKDPYWRDAQMIDGRLIFVWLGWKGVHIWDAGEGKLLHRVDVAWGKSGGLKMSRDGSKVFLQTRQLIQAWSTWTGEAAGEVWVGNWSFVHSLHVDDSKIWVHSIDKPTQGWDFGIPGSSPVLLSQTPPEEPRLHFICNNNDWNDDPSRIKDLVTGKEVFWLPKRYAVPFKVQWDGQYLVAGYESGEVLILDFCDVCP